MLVNMIYSFINFEERKKFKIKKIYIFLKLKFEVFSLKIVELF